MYIQRYSCPIADAKSVFYECFRKTTYSTAEVNPNLLPQVSLNYRSHKQMVNVASLVIHLLYKGLNPLSAGSPGVGSLICRGPVERRLDLSGGEPFKRREEMACVEGEQGPTHGAA